MKYLLVIAMLSTLLVAVACQPVQAPADAASGQLQDTIWILTDMDGEAVMAEIEISAVFMEDGTLAGKSGCNNYSTSYDVDGQSMTINPQIMSTMMMCPDPNMKIEQVYQQALPTVATYEVSGDTLVLSDANDEALLTYSAQSQDLAGTSWVVISYNNGKEAVVSVITDTELTANFGEDGVVAGSSGCNNYTGSYETDGENISIGPMAATMMMCVDEAVMIQEGLFLVAMESAATFSVEGTKLQFRTADGAMAVNFQAAD